MVLAVEGAGNEGPGEARQEGGPRGPPGSTQQGSPWCTYLGQDLV